MSDLLEFDDAAKLMRTSVETLRRWRRAGYGPRSATFGRRVFYRRTDVEAWINDQFVS